MSPRLVAVHPARGIDSTRVTDRGLHNLKGLPKLSKIWLYNTLVSDVGIASLKREIPRLEVGN